MKSVYTRKAQFQEVIDGIKTESSVKLTEPLNKGQEVLVREIDDHECTGRNAVVIIDSCKPVNGEHINNVATDFEVKHHLSK